MDTVNKKSIGFQPVTLFMYKYGNNDNALYFTIYLSFNADLARAKRSDFEENWDKLSSFGMSTI